MKNIISNTVLALLAIACISFFSACLKDDAHFTDFSKVGTVVELLDANTDVISTDPTLLGLTAAGLTFSTTPADVTTRVNVAAPYALSTALNVTLSVDKAAFVAWKKLKQDSIYDLLPDSCFTVPSAGITIPANQNVGSFVVKVNSSKVDLNHSYVLPVSISDASGQNISGNFKTILYSISVKNIYDGTYSAKGTLDRQGNPTQNITQDVVLSTVNGTTSYTQAPYFNQVGVALLVRVNADNTVTILPDPTQAIQIKATAGKVSTYDPAKKQFHLYYNYVNGSGLSRVFDFIYTLK